MPSSLARSFPGKGVKVAVLDTGMYLAHPDFAGREVVAKSFNTREKRGMNAHGHGTHAAGIAVGDSGRASGIRYGTASDAACNWESAFQF